MQLDRRFLVVVASSLLWAALVSAAFYRVASRAAARPPEQTEKNLVVAAEPLPLGAVVMPQYVKTVRVPERLFPAGGFGSPEEVVDRPVVSPILAGEPVLEGRLAARGSGMGLAPLIPPGMRALSVRVNDVVGVAGFVLPGMRVDVLVTGRPPGKEDSVTSTVLENILVLSAGQTIQADAKASSITVPAVTLLVDPAQAEILTLASTEGRIQLVLRNSTDQQKASPPGRELRELYGTAPRAPVREAVRAPSRPPRAQPEAAARPAPAAALPVALFPMGDEVVMIRGNQKTLETPQPGKAN